MLENWTWIEKYRPHTVADCILPQALKDSFSGFVAKGNAPNLILSGTSGLGKTTVARAMLDELGFDHIIINGSMNGNIDTLRNEISNFASSVAMNGKRKFVILDEADYLNANSTQPALRNFMEAFSANCGFILTCNNKSRIIEPLHSRCAIVDFKIPKKEAPRISSQFLKRIEYILKTEGVEYDKQVVAAVMIKFFPDWRRVLNELQRYSIQGSGKIDSGMLTSFQEVLVSDLYAMCKNKEFDKARKWITDNADLDQTTIFNMMYADCDKYVTKQTIPLLVLKIAEYSYKGAFVADHQINVLAFLIEIMRECEYL